MKLVLAEKPSVAMSLSKVIGADQRGDGYMEGNGYLVSWCVGHLVELSQPEAYDEKYAKWRYDDLPILPDHWRYQVSASTKKQFGILKKLMQRKDVESLICATDTGREGELIFRLVYHQCGCKKLVERLWISSMEDSAIREGFQKLRPGTEYDMGWRQYAGKPVEDAEKNAEAGDLPELSEGMTLELAGVNLKEGKTSPPKRFTEDLLLSAMESASSDEFPAGVERKGIGTPATRAAIIEKLVQKGFIERRGDRKTKFLCSTDKGNALVTVVPEQIQSPSMTADWEEKLLKMEHGEYDSDAFMGEISSMVSGLVKTYEAVKGADVLIQPERKVIGSCPVCGSDVCETAKGWFCRDKNCKFALWKENRFFQTLGKQMTEELAKQLVNQGKARLIHCYSRKSNRYYDTTVHVETGEDGAAAFKLEFGGKK